MQLAYFPFSSPAVREMCRKNPFCSEQENQSDQVNQLDHVDQLDQSDQLDQLDQSDQLDKVEHLDKADKLDRVNQSDQSDQGLMESLHQLCMEAGVFSLQNMLQGEDVRDILVKEGMLDYLQCLPWCLPQGSPAQARAKELVEFVGQKMQLQPPSLATMARARIAASYLGLQKVLKTLSVQMLFLEICRL